MIKAVRPGMYSETDVLQILVSPSSQAGLLPPSHLGTDEARMSRAFSAYDLSFVS